MNINKKYLPLWTDEEYDTAILSGGRSSGKSFSAQVFINDLSYESGHKIIISRFTMASAKISIVPEFKEKLPLLKSPYGNYDREQDFDLNMSDAVNLHSLSEIYFMGLKSGSGTQTARLKSINGITTLLIEEAEEIPDDGTDNSASTYDKIEDSIRTKNKRLRKIVLWNPSDVNSFVYKRFFKNKGEDGKDLPIDFNGRMGRTLYIYTTYEDNRENINKILLEKIENMRVSNPLRFKHIYLGFPLKDVDGALWKKSTMIDPYRIHESDRPELKRTVTSVDPSVSDDPCDECGIGTAAMDFQYPPHFYILSDVSGQMTNRQWGQTAIGEYKNHNSDRLIAEKNQGGDLVKMNLHNIDPNIEPKLITAKKSKIARSEPIAALYEAGRVHHVGHFPELETELCTYDGNGPSPNRLDWMVYAITELSQNEVVEVRIRSL